MRKDCLLLTGKLWSILFLTGVLIGGISGSASAQIPGGTLPPSDVDKYVAPLIKPPAMPGDFKKNKDKYKIAVRQFTQQILPSGVTARLIIQALYWRAGHSTIPLSQSKRLIIKMFK